MGDLDGPDDEIWNSPVLSHDHITTHHFYHEVMTKGLDLKKDAVKKLDGVIVDGKKFMRKLPLVETVEKKVTSSLNSLPGLVNLPSKSDIKKLTQAMKSLHKNIETLNIQKMM